MVKGTLLREKEILTRHWLTLKSETHQIGENGEFDFTIVNGPDWTLTIPLTKDNKFVMIRQYRPAWRQISMEFPAGRNHHDETFVEAAQRELREETGYIAESWEEILSSRPITWTNQATKFYIAEELTRVGQDLDKEEDIEVIKVDPDEFWSYYEKGEIIQQATILAYLLWKQHVNH